jgi:hypothetical protein
MQPMLAAKTLRWCLFLALSISIGLAAADEHDSASAQLLAASSSTALSAPHATCIASLLQRIVEDAGVHGSQRLYLGPPIEENGGVVVRVYWQEARAILLIDTAIECNDNGELHEASDLGWYRPKARIDLDTDVVATPDDVGGSTYLVDKPWADAVIAECLKSAPLIIEPSSR